MKSLKTSGRTQSTCLCDVCCECCYMAVSLDLCLCYCYGYVWVCISCLRSSVSSVFSEPCLCLCFGFVCLSWTDSSPASWPVSLPLMNSSLNWTCSACSVNFFSSCFWHKRWQNEFAGEQRPTLSETTPFLQVLWHWQVAVTTTEGHCGFSSHWIHVSTADAAVFTR